MSYRSTTIRSIFAGLMFACVATAQAADDIEHFPLQLAIDEATAAGKLDGSVKFYLAGTGPKGNVLSAGVVTNKKSNAFGKDNQTVCVWTAQSALIALQASAKQAGANAVINITSYFRKSEYSHNKNFECHVGAIMAGVALRGDLVRTDN